MNEEKLLLVIDMQNDFVTGALANREAEAIIGIIADKIEFYRREGHPVLFTRDTHGDDYMETQEGRLLPAAHCLKGSEGWQIVDPLKAYAEEKDVLDKPVFGSLQLPQWISEKLGSVPKEIELCGVCTDICVISNAMILKAAFPETIVTVEGASCAGVTPESHQTALAAMKACQVIVK